MVVALMGGVVVAGVVFLGSDTNFLYLNVFRLCLPATSEEADKDHWNKDQSCVFNKPPCSI
jgi:hypothetical protein